MELAREEVISTYLVNHVIVSLYMATPIPVNSHKFSSQSMTKTNPASNAYSAKSKL
jgi:hypothetical protein